MKAIITPILLMCAAFAVLIGAAAVLRGCHNEYKTDFVIDRGDYRYVKLEEEQFNRLIKALENIAAQKGTNDTSNR